MASLGPVFFDTSVLLAGLLESLGGESEDAHVILGAVAGGKVARASTAWHCCLEFYSVATRLPEEFRLTSQDALDLLKAEILPRFRIHQLPSTDYRELLEEAAYDKVTGGRIYDAHIASIARAARAKLVITSNRRHFASLLRHGIRVLDCREFARILSA